MRRDPLALYYQGVQTAPPKSTIDNAAKYKIGSYWSFDTDQIDDIEQIRQRIVVDGQPVIFGMSVYDSFESDQVTRTGYVPVPDVNREKLLGGHAVLIVGYDDDKEVCSNTGAFKVMNSYGISWGQEGFFWLPYEFVRQGLAYDFWVLAL